MLLYIVAFWACLLIADVEAKKDRRPEAIFLRDATHPEDEIIETTSEQKILFTLKQKQYIDHLNPEIPRHCKPSRTRREIRVMSDGEWKAFVEAVKALKTTMIDGVSQYHLFVMQHGNIVSPEAHGRPAIYSYHREYLFRFENALREHRPDVYLPYWDSTLDSKLPTPADSILWSDELMGTRTGIVTSGPFANWTVTPHCDLGSGLLRRDVVKNSKYPGNRLFNDKDIQDALSYNTFQDFYSCHLFRVHGGIHAFVGGTFINNCSPSDPLLFIYHAFIDYIWETFRQTSQTTQLSEYMFAGKRSSKYHPDAPLKPFLPLKNRDGLRTHYTRCFYNYERRPYSCLRHSDCGPRDFLFCQRGTCVSKVLSGGNCTGLPDIACYSSHLCIDGICL